MRVTRAYSTLLLRAGKHQYYIFTKKTKKTGMHEYGMIMCFHRSENYNWLEYKKIKFNRLEPHFSDF